MTQEEKQASLPYEPPFDENPSDREIIEALIHHLNEQDGFLTAINCVTTKVILSWLKKQKEQKPTEINMKALLAADRLASAEMTGRLKERSEILENPEKYGLQKLAKWNEDWREEDIQTRFAFYTYKDDPSVLYLSNVFVEEASRNHGFGTRILSAAEKVAETIGATTISLKVKQDSPANDWYRKNGYGYVAFEDGYDWLEKNLEYMKPNKQEWSEEDRINLNSILNHLKEYLTNGAYTYYERWLKSLRPSWKPSEEELVTLKNVGGILRNYGYGELAKTVFMIEGKLANLSV